VLVDIYHLTNKDFSEFNAYYYGKYISKPHCEQGGIADIDPGSLVAIPPSYPLVNRVWGKIVYGDADWVIIFPKNYNYTAPSGDGITLTVKAYCSYPIQCIKQ